MKRREFITLLGGVATAFPLMAVAQQPGTVRRIGVLMARGANDPESRTQVSALEQGLQEFGWSQNHNVVIEVLLQEEKSAEHCRRVDGRVPIGSWPRV